MRNNILHVETDLFADYIQQEAMGPRDAIVQYAHRDLEAASLAVQCTKITMHTKQGLESWLHDGDIKDYLMERK
jgi:hypothetical protein